MGKAVFQRAASPLTAAAATQTLVIFAIRTRRNDRRAARFTTHHRLR